VAAAMAVGVNESASDKSIISVDVGNEMFFRKRRSVDHFFSDVTGDCFLI
jgi:hypothetical protein